MHARKQAAVVKRALKRIKEKHGNSSMKQYISHISEKES